MVQFYIFNPAHKLRVLSTLLYQGSRRLLRSATTPSTVSARSGKVTISSLINTDLPTLPSGALIHDADFYKSDSDGGFCVFRVENTLFRVHRCFLLREPSAFGDMFSLPYFANNFEGTSDESPIPLSDTAEKFRDLLWALYALPNELCLTPHPQIQPLSLDRLMNVAELTNKYCYSSYESWAVERIYVLAQDPIGFLQNASPEICARVLNIAVLCNNQNLLDLVSHKLILRMLWSNMCPNSVLVVAQRHGLRRLIGIAYYRQLISMEQVSYDGIISTQPFFASSLDVEKRMRFLSAHHSLVSLWKQIRTTAPCFQSSGCHSHSICLSTWQNVWSDAGIANQTLHFGSADVLGRLKFMMIYLRKAMAEVPSMSLQCTLSALEAITTTRDDIIDGMLDHFTDF
ncbi:hypothetical protein BDQ12DRAFT_689102 [Crucibulum laeve]|uniref:BTB domain-containing protein n=1 Tax=Crucibulum laeve TaxID=68775 RepID=A0A5C3LNH2_9AGAR|nr:hypothetical protein BDQ12DRAFT_689102 [Crucibulum laeve]